MLKQISVRSIASTGASVKKMYDEAQTYLENIGFKKTELMSVTDSGNTFRSYIFTQGKEKVLLEMKQDPVEEMLKLVFSPMEIKFVHDILLMRFNQLGKEKGIFIYEGNPHIDG
ncbi:MAG: hypothetical protein NDI94_00120 [Candidatus Woesearchaeota archaeon]|nr:hypothetical protein [Candidatus Woesearchaeota archaeon]